jgi:hypothetical protein
MNIEFTIESLRRFKMAYREACRVGVRTFKFDGNEFDVGYAHYLIEYLNIRFGFSINDGLKDTHS